MSERVKFEKHYGIKKDSLNGVGLYLNPDHGLLWQGWSACAVQKDKTIAHLQSQIDSLMLEYCPDDMTEAQLENWAQHQRQV